MKRLLILSFVLLNIACYSQDSSGFKESDEIISVNKSTSSNLNFCKDQVKGTLTIEEDKSAKEESQENIIYQWQRKSQNGSWVKISGATKSTYNINSLSQSTILRRMEVSSHGQKKMGSEIRINIKDSGCI